VAAAGCGSAQSAPCCSGELNIAAAPATAHEHEGGRREDWRLATALALAGTAEVIVLAASGAAVWQGSGMPLASLAIALAGTAVFRNGLRALSRGNLNINALMSVAVAGAFVIGEWPEAAMVMALYSLAELIEHRSVDRARHAIKELLDLSPPQAERRDAAGRWERIGRASW